MSNETQNDNGGSGRLNLEGYRAAAAGLASPFTAQMLAAKTGTTMKAAYSAIYRLRRAGLVIQTAKHGQWQMGSV